ncbi:MAG: DUF4435 domain-containing protein [Prevotellaceae bacterium]|nr:DUF4435 domain-containing protein [Candidatus Minthosoma caballi]
MKKLVSNINSAYLEAANRLRPQRKKRKIVAYVESYDDIFFWRSILSEFENEEREFEVMLPSKTNLNRGKKTAMMNKLGENLGDCMIACVDADLDYLLQRHTQNSARMLDNPYVVHTYAYAIENLQCYAPSLHNVCVMATLNDRNIFNFEEYLKQYSEIVYELFVWLVWMHREGRFNEFPLSSFNNICSVEQLNVYKPITALEQLKKNVNRKIAYLQKNVHEAKGKLTPLKIELEQLGVTRETTYLFIQGHHLMENVVSCALDPVCTILRREREKEIKILAGNNIKQMDNEMSCYQHSQAVPAQMIRRNTQYKDAAPYKMIKEHIEKILN